MTESHREEIAKLEAMFAANPGGRSFAHLAEAYRKAGDLARAREVLEAGLARHQEYPSAHVVLGRVLWDEGKLEEAEAAFKRVLELDPHNLVALKALGDLAAEAGRTGEALGYFRELLAIEPGNEETARVVAELEQWMAEAPESESDAAAAAPRIETTRWARPEERALGAEKDERTSVPLQRPDEEVFGRLPGLPGGEGRPVEFEPVDWPGPDVEPEPEDTAVVTETMASLYALQGHHEKAAEVLRELVRRRPGDEALREKLAAAEAAVAAKAAEAEAAEAEAGGEATVEPDAEVAGDGEPAAEGAGGGAEAAAQEPVPAGAGGGVAEGVHGEADEGGEDGFGEAAAGIEFRREDPDGALEAEAAAGPDHEAGIEFRREESAEPLEPEPTAGQALEAEAEAGREDPAEPPAPARAEPLEYMYEPDSEPEPPREVIAEAREELGLIPLAEPEVGPAAGEVEPDPEMEELITGFFEEAIGGEPTSPEALAPPAEEVVAEPEAGEPAEASAEAGTAPAAEAEKPAWAEAAAEPVEAEPAESPPEEEAVVAAAQAGPADAASEGEEPESSALAAQESGEGGGDEGEELRVEAIESAWTGGQGVAGGEESPYSMVEEARGEAAADEPAIGSYFRDLLSWRPTGGGAAPVAVAAGAGSAAAPGASAEAGAEPVSSGAGGEEDELDRLFGPDSPLFGQADPTGQAAGPAPEPAEGGEGVADPESDDDDLEMFRAWLQSLKR